MAIKWFSFKPWNLICSSSWLLGLEQVTERTCIAGIRVSWPRLCITMIQQDYIHFLVRATSRVAAPSILCQKRGRRTEAMSWPTTTTSWILTHITQWWALITRRIKRSTKIHTRLKWSVTKIWITLCLMKEWKKFIIKSLELEVWKHNITHCI